MDGMLRSPCLGASISPQKLRLSLETLRVSYVQTRLCRYFLVPELASNAVNLIIHFGISNQGRAEAVCFRSLDPLRYPVTAG